MKEIDLGIFKSDDNDNIFIVGDIHGDYECLIHCLVDLCKCCYIIKHNNECQKLKWIENNDTKLIFTGDLIHRKRFENVLDDECSDVYIIEEILRLKDEAKKYNGDIILVSGNHEIMNIIYPENGSYTSPKNKKENLKFFTDKKKINFYIDNSYAWIKINDILIVHGGLCSQYMGYIEKKNPDKKGIEIIKHINKKYRDYFTNFNYKKKEKDSEAYNLFEAYELDPNSLKHNMFWCRQWGYSNIKCNELKDLIGKVDCGKMIVAHCPQFLDPDKPQTISFRCENKNDGFNLARIDLGMSRAFEYNCCDDKRLTIDKDNFDESNIKMFLKYLKFNFNRKIQVLRLINKDDKLNFNYSSIITEKLSCLQYLLLKYGIKKKYWKKKGIESDWIGFDLIDMLCNKNFLKKCNNDKVELNNSFSIIENILCEVVKKKNEDDLFSVECFYKNNHF